MLSKALFTLAVCIMGVASAADPPASVLEANGPTTVEVGKKAIVKVATTAKKVTWKIPAGCDTETLDGKRLAVWALPGTYTFVAMVPNGDDVISVDCVLTVTGPRPPPAPTPVDPVDPVLTPFQVKLQAAFRADTGATLDSKSKYAAFYRQAAKTAQDNSLTTAGALTTDMATAVKLLGIPPGSLVNTARAIEAEITPLLPKSPATLLDGPTRALYTQTYNRIAADLEVIK